MRTVNALDEVKASRVHLVLPERSAFLREERPASASVTVQLEVGQSLSKAQVQGITALVAGAVDGLEVSDVVLVDDKGRLLSSDRDNDEMTMGLPALFEARQAYETAVELRPGYAKRELHELFEPSVYPDYQHRFMEALTVAGLPP